jgi:hypothetical protein
MSDTDPDSVINRCALIGAILFITARRSKLSDPAECCLGIHSEGLSLHTRIYPTADALPNNTQTAAPRLFLKPVNPVTGTKQMTTLSELKKEALKLIGENHIKEAFELLSGALNPDNQPFKDLILHSFKYRQTSQSELKDVISREEVIREKGKVVVALLELINQLKETDLGSGGSLNDPLEDAARKLPVDKILTPLYRVNCDRKKPNRDFWRSFDSGLDQQQHFQFYFLTSCPSQQPEGFIERTVQEILEKDLEGEAGAIDFRRNPGKDNLLLIEDFPASRRLETSKNAFKKYFTERFHLADANFDDYIRTGLPKLPFKYVATAFRIISEDWDEEITPEYITWMMDVFSQTGPNIPTFLFFFIIKVKNAHLGSHMRGSDKEVLKNILTFKESLQNKQDATFIEPLTPVPAEDLETWLERLGADITNQQKRDIINLLAGRLRDEEKAAYDSRREINMEHIEDFQKLVYTFHKNK